MNIIDIINNNKWRFAKTYANTHPHEYIVKGRCSSDEDFDFLCEYIKKNGETQHFFNWTGTYLSIGDYTYWAMGNVINRRWNDMYFVDEKTKKIFKVDNWKELIKDGRVSNK